MGLSRRRIILGLTASALAGCASRVPTDVRTTSSSTYRPVSDPGFDSWVSEFQTRAAGQGISQATLSQAFRGAGFLPDVVKRDRNQAETVRSIEDYLAISASEEKISTGRTMLRRHAAVLAEIDDKFGVEPAIVTAIWGVESRYGERRGDVPVISALATLAYDGRRGPFFERQLMASLRILQRGDVTAARMTGSWAGAMGHTQFIPTTYEAYAVDLRNDGRRDIWSDDPTDALASAAAYIKRSGWRRGQPWGIEVRLPEGFNTQTAGRGTGRSTLEWSAMGVRPASGGPLPDHGTASLILPAGVTGPAFLIYQNFKVLTRYNNAEKYVIGVGHLSDRLQGGPPLRAGFPPDANGMSIDDRRALQRRLTAAGFDTEGIDGVIGDKTREAIRRFQAKAGLPVTGEPSLELLRRLG